MALPWQGCWLPTWPMTWSSYLHVQFIPLQLSNFNLYFKIPRTDSSTGVSKAVWDLGRCMGLSTPEEVKISEREDSSHCLQCITEIPPGISPLAHMHTCGIHNCIQVIHSEWQTGQENFDSRTVHTTSFPNSTVFYAYSLRFYGWHTLASYPPLPLHTMAHVFQVLLKTITHTDQSHPKPYYTLIIK